MLTANPRITAAGLALFTNQAPGYSVAITDIALGTPQYDPNGTETTLHAEFARFPVTSGANLSSTQIQVGTLITNADPQGRTTAGKTVGEIGFFVGTVLLAVLSISTRELFHKSLDLDVPITHLLNYSILPPGSLTVTPAALSAGIELASGFAQAAATAAISAQNAVRASYYGPFEAAPALRPDGTARQKGDRYFDTVAGAEKTFNGAAWYTPNVDTAALAGSGGTAMIGGLWFGGAVASTEKLGTSSGAKYIGVKRDGAAVSVEASLRGLNSRVRREIVAHRGFARDAPENTLLAFSNAIARHADTLEFDCQISSDGVIYVFHDTTVDALTNSAGAFTAQTSAAIDAMTFKATAGTPFAGLKIPRLTQVLDLARAAGIKIMPELIGVWTNAQITAFLDTLNTYGYKTEKACAQLSDITYAETMRGLSPDIGIALVGAGTLAGSSALIDRMSAAGSASIMWDYAALLAEPGIVSYAYSKSVDVVAGTIPNTETMRRLREIGVSRFCCDGAMGGLV